jgi:dihydroorotase
MKVLLRKVIISPAHTGPTDILIENGIIKKIAKDINEEADTVIQENNLHVSAGWMDCFADFSDPGYEQNENLDSGARAAAAGGYTSLMVIPNTNPVIHDKSQVEYIVQRSKSLPVNIYPIGAVTKNTEGKDLGEMYDMHRSGAVAFSDGTHTIQSSGILLKALEYVKAINAVIIQVPGDKSISPSGLMNEGIVSMQLGLPGKPAIAEEISIARDVELVAYTGSAIHFTGVSTKRGLDIISKAKKDGLKVSCSVTPHHLYFNDEDLRDYDTRLKVNPPLRTKEDMLALRQGIKEGIIDCIASHHEPRHWDDKTCEFEYAKNGATGLESVFGVARACGISNDDFTKMQTENVRKIFNVEMPVVKEGAKADLTLFDPDIEYTFGEKNILSRSKNNPFIGRTLKGKSFGFINGDKLFLSEREIIDNPKI